MSRKPDLTDDDRELFRHAMEGVRPISTDDRVAPAPLRPRPRPRQRELDERRVLDELLELPDDPTLLETGEELLYARPGLQHNILRKLRRGQFAVSGELDLHGMTVAEASTALADFLRTARRDTRRCVRIIHGKGNGSLNCRPVLKGKVNQWLRHRDEVLAFCSARPVDGGTGAIYLLLRRTEN